MLNRLSFIQNNLFKRVLTVTIPQSQIHQMLLFFTAAELQDNPIKSFVQALRRRPQKNYNCRTIISDGLQKKEHHPQGGGGVWILNGMAHVASLGLIYTCIYD